MRNDFLYMPICYESSLPFCTMAQHELSFSIGRLKPWRPLMQVIALRRGAKLILVRIYVIESEYDSSFFSAFVLANFFHSSRCGRCHNLMQENTRGPKLRFWTSRICCSYFRHFKFSWYLYASTEFFGHDLKSGLTVFTLT